MLRLSKEEKRRLLWKETEVEIPKCKYFLADTKCSDPYCVYSHRKEPEYTIKKVPMVDIIENLIKFDFTNKLYIPKKSFKRGCFIKKNVLRNGSGVRPNNFSKVVYRYYGMYWTKGNEQKVFRDCRGELYSLVINTNFRSKTYLYDPKKKKSPSFFHICLSSMLRGEEAVFRIHPHYFREQDFAKAGISMSFETGGKKQDLENWNYIYYFFKCDDIEHKISFRDLPFQNEKDGVLWVKKKMEEYGILREKALKIPIEKNLSFKNTKRRNSLKKVAEKYEFLVNVLFRHRKLKFVKNEEFLNQKRELLTKIGNRVCNINILRRDYVGARRNAELAMDSSPRAFKPRYYLLLTWKLEKRDVKALEIFRELETLIIKKEVDIDDEKNLKLFEKEKNFFELMQKKSEKEEKKFQKNFGKGLKDGFYSSIVSEDLEKEKVRMDELDKKLGRKVWFDEEGNEFYTYMENLDEKEKLINSLLKKKKESELSEN